MSLLAILLDSIGLAFVTVVEFDELVVVVVEPPFEFVVVVEFDTDAFLGALLLLPPLSGQAAPNKPNVKTAERAITFFIRLYSPVFFKECYVYFIV